MIGPYPPPEGGWSTAIREEREVLESKGVNVLVLNIGPDRKTHSDKYIRVVGAIDLFFKMLWFSMRGYIFRLHMNGDSPKGMLIILFAEVISMLSLHRSCLSFHAGVNQRYFPHRGNRALKLMWFLVFTMPKVIFCDCEEVREIILMYRLKRESVHAISPFSSRRISFTAVDLDEKIVSFLQAHSPSIFTYFAYRSEYTIDVLFGAFLRLKKEFPTAGLIAFDDRTHPSPMILAQATSMGADMQDIMLLGSRERDFFLTVLSRTDFYLRTPITDGVCSSVLEALHLGVPVVASDNGHRPDGVITYIGGSEDDLLDKLIYATLHRIEIRARIQEIKMKINDSVEDLVSALESYYWKQR